MDFRFGFYIENKTNLTKPELLITSKLLVFHAYLYIFFIIQKIRASDKKLTSDSDSTSKNT